MELMRKNIHMNRLKAKASTQITMEDDFNVPDVKADIDTMVTNSGKVMMDGIRVSSGKVNVRGRLKFSVLYGSFGDNRLLHNMTGEIPFDENINVEGITDTDSVNVRWDIDGLNIGIINTRKISVKAVVTFSFTAEDIYDIEPVVEIQEGTKIDCLKKHFDISQIAVCKKDIFRIKEDVDIASNKPNMSEILWENVNLKNITTRLSEGKIELSGEVLLFVLYESEEENGPVQWTESVVPFNGLIEMSDCSEDMIADISTAVASAGVNIKPDYDGEQRVLELDMVLDLNMKVFKEDTVEIVADVNSSAFELSPEYENVPINSVIMKNIAKCKVTDKLKLDSTKGHIMQLCSSCGKVKIDNISSEDNVILVKGMVDIDVMYISSDDKMPICVAKEIVPFEHSIEARGVNKNTVTIIRPSMEQLSANMAGNNEIEMKGYVALDCLAFDSYNEEIITDITQNPLDLEKIQNIPGIVGYRVKEDDTLWKIAKKYYTSVDSIKNLNELKSDQIREGDMLLVVKDAVG